MHDGPGRQSGGVSAFFLNHVRNHVEFVKAADDARYLWLKLKDVVPDYPELYQVLCVCCMPQKKGLLGIAEGHTCAPTASCLFNCMQSDVLEFQSRVAQSLVCGDL